MRCLDLSLIAPEENLALDEALLDQAETTGHEVLRFWESPVYFVVLGFSSPIQKDVHLDYCQNQKIPVFRRSSGGGTVVQGPGCLNYALILNMKTRPELRSLNRTNQMIMEHHKKNLDQILSSVQTAGITDLIHNGKKFSGNAQRRKKDFLLFHGTFLYQFDVDMMKKCLKIPERQPDYREGRSHADFTSNIPLRASKIRETIQSSWKADAPFDLTQLPALAPSLQARYLNPTWTTKF